MGRGISAREGRWKERGTLERSECGATGTFFYLFDDRRSDDKTPRPIWTLQRHGPGS